MPKESTIVGLDVGTSFIRIVVAKIKADKPKLQIIGFSQVPAFGIRRGAVVDVEEAGRSILRAIQEAEQASGLPIERVYVSLDGNHVSPKVSKGVVAVSRADNEVSREDISRAINAASAISVSQNREILHIIPRGFSLDNQIGIKDPVGMSGIRLEVETLIIEGASPFIKNLTKCVSEAGLEIEGLVLSSLAASRAALTKHQKELGVLALDLGGGTSSLTVFEEGDIIHSCILPIGSAHITNDIAICLRTNIDVAEKVKLEYGSALISEIGKKEIIDLSKLEPTEQGVFPRIEVAEIIEARLSEILELVNKELKKVDRQGLLPAGVVLLGGGAKMPGLVDLVKERLKLPAQVGFPLGFEGMTEKIDDPSFATAVGLVLWGMDNYLKENVQGFGLGSSLINSSLAKIKHWFRGFLP